MDDDTVGHLWALREVNKSLILGLNTAIFVMENWDDLTDERKKSMIAHKGSSLRLAFVVVESNTWVLGLHS